MRNGLPTSINTKKQDPNDVNKMSSIPREKGRVVHFQGYSSFVTYKLLIFHSTVRIQFFSINPFLLSW